MSARTTRIVTSEFEGARLDHALAILVPGMGLRGRKRLVERGGVLVDGRVARKGERMRAGQTLALVGDAPPPGHGAAAAASVHIVAENEDFIALYKPAGMHTAHLAGGSGEACLEVLLPDLAPGAVLLNRLDRPTSGMVLAGKTPDSAARYHRLEDAGAVDKRYLALLEGELRQDAVVRQALDAARRKGVRVLDRIADPLRWTWLRPLRVFQEGGAVRTLVEARIHKGARHQIRAHCAHLGAPIVGDDLYGGGRGPLRLHHGRLTLPGFTARCAPPWLEDCAPELADSWT